MNELCDLDKITVPKTIPYIFIVSNMFKDLLRTNHFIETAEDKKLTHDFSSA